MLDRDTGAEYAGGALDPTSDPQLIKAVNALIDIAREVGAYVVPVQPTVELTREYNRRRKQIHAIVEAM